MVEKKEEIKQKIVKKSSEGLGISGFTLGVLSIIFAGGMGAIVSLTGFIFCLIQQKKNPNQLSRIGLTLNIIGFIVSVAYIILIYSGVIPTQLV
jgi:hypothetical protein